MARYRLMELYRGRMRKRDEDAIKQGRAILATRGVRHNLENEVRVEVALIVCDFLGKVEEAELERSAVTDGPGRFSRCLRGLASPGKGARQTAAR